MCTGADPNAAHEHKCIAMCVWFEMLPYLLELFIIIYILVLVLGFLQTPPLSLTPKNLSPEEAADQAHNAKVYGITAVSVIAVQAIVTVASYFEGYQTRPWVVKPSFGRSREV